MTPRDDPLRPVGPLRWLAALLLALAVMGSACTAGDGSPAGPTTSDAGPNAGTPPTLAGGVELASVPPSRVLVGEGLAFGTPLPSQQVAADVFTDDPEVASALVRGVFSRTDGRLIGEVLALTLDGGEVFDQDVLDAFVSGVVAALGDGSHDELAVGERTVLRSRSEEGVVLGFLEGDQLVLVRGANERDIEVVVERQLAAIAAGVDGSVDPVTPLVPVPIDAAFVAVPAVAFQPIPPPEEEPVLEPVAPPDLPAATAVQGRYGVVAGERRVTVWAYAVDPAVYGSAEALTPAVAAMVSARAGGAAADGVELIDRVVQRATGGDGASSVSAFRHGSLVLLVEGADPAQVDAVVAAWIVALAP